MSYTLADLKAHAEEPVEILHDESVPDGYFAVIATILGTFTTYLLKGESDTDEAAVIVGRIESPNSLEGATYKGGGIKGGEDLGEFDHYEDSFARMI